MSFSLSVIVFLLVVAIVVVTLFYFVHHNLNKFKEETLKIMLDTQEDEISKAKRNLLRKEKEVERYIQGRHYAMSMSNRFLTGFNSRGEAQFEELDLSMVSLTSYYHLSEKEKNLLALDNILYLTKNEVLSYHKSYPEWDTWDLREKKKTRIDWLGDD